MCEKHGDSFFIPDLKQIKTPTKGLWAFYQIQFALYAK
ncbi:hypothetical protein D051_2047 [Vibrio parahaemolyticus VPCR-2010]|nr:hypothetical protein D024_2740 [Vibrio parahaemolyticus 3259]EQM36681.1 hypothetical protein D051_2047 [Vibrio parahaemolyticus VPCR-2010]ETY27865.1 hypothetical protein D039_1707 [Vibrio parahaemolyticus EKP-028]EXF70041.1 hypothetical protein D030_2450 [Vibrio parahaemolyticus AQ3810]